MRRLATRGRDQRAGLDPRKMDAIARVTSGIAHDINNVLTAILGNVELLRDMVESDLPPEDAPRWRSCLDGIDDVSRRAASLTERLLNMTRPCRDAPTELDLIEWIRNARGRWCDSVASGCRIGLASSESPMRITIQESVLAEILDSIVANAAEAMPGGGPIQIDVSRRRDDGVEWAVVEITDDGAGITDEIRDLIFEPFFTTKAVGKAVGFGLPTVYARLNQIGGSVDVSMSEDRGVRCRILLPVHGRAAAAGRRAEPTKVG